MTPGSSLNPVRDPRVTGRFHAPAPAPACTSMHPVTSYMQATKQLRKVWLKRNDHANRAEHEFISEYGVTGQTFSAYTLSTSCIRVLCRFVGNLPVCEVFCFTRSRSSAACMCACDFVVGGTRNGNWERSYSTLHFIHRTL